MQGLKIASCDRDELDAINCLRASLPTLPVHQQHALIELVHSRVIFSYVSEPQHRDAYRLFCRLISSGEAASSFCDRHMALLGMMESDESFEDFRKLVTTFIRGKEGSFAIIGTLASKDSFRRMFRQLLQDGWLLPREEDTNTREVMKLLHAQFAYREGHGPKPICVFDDQKFEAILEDKRVFQSVSLHEPDESDSSHAARRVGDFFAKHPSSTWKQASEALSMSLQRVKRLHKKSKSGKKASQLLRKLQTSMGEEALHQTAYTQITFENGTKAILAFEPSERGCVLWSEWAISHPFPTTSADMNSLLQSKWSSFVEHEIYQSLGPETSLGRFFCGNRHLHVFSQAESKELYRHDLQRELYELALPWYSGGGDSVRAAHRIKDIGQELYDMGEGAAFCQDGSDMGAMLSVYAYIFERTGRLPDDCFANARRLYGYGHAAMELHFISLGVLAGVFDEVSKTIVPAARHSLPGTRGGIVKMLHTKNLRGELEITGWQCVVEMLWHGIGQWEN